MSRSKIVIFGFSANPPANHHLAIVLKLSELFDKVIIIPRGTGSNKLSTTLTTPNQRKDMVGLLFLNFPDLKIDFYDLDNNVFTPTWLIDKKYKEKYPDSEIWHTAGGDLIQGGKNNQSEIQRIWQKGNYIWQTLNWAVIDNPSCPVDPIDLPPKNLMVKLPKLIGRSTTIRNKLAAGQPISNLVPPAIEKYILKNNLYK